MDKSIRKHHRETLGNKKEVRLEMESWTFFGCIRMKEQIIEKGELLDVGSENGSSKLDLPDTL